MVVTKPKTNPAKKVKPILALHNQRMLALIDYVVNNYADYKSIDSVLVAIGFNNKSIGQVYNKKQSFRIAHFVKAMELFGVDANFFFKKDHTKMFPEAVARPVLVELMEVAARVAIELNGKK